MASDEMLTYKNKRLTIVRGLIYSSYIYVNAEVLWLSNVYLVENSLSTVHWKE